MARPKKNNADYFSHDAGMRDDPKIKALRKKFRTEGYSVWCMMLELLTASEGFKYKWNPLNIEIIAGDFDIDSARIEEIVNYMLLLELVTIEDGYIFSPKHISRFSGLMSKRDRDNQRYNQGQTEEETPIKEVSADGNTPKQNVSADGSTQSKVKETKEKDKSIYRAFAHLKITVSDFNKLIEAGYSKEQIDVKLDDIENWKKNKNYSDLYKTVNNWLKKDFPQVVFKQQKSEANKSSEFDYDSLNAQRLAALHPNQNKAIA